MCPEKQSKSPVGSVSVAIAISCWVHLEGTPNGGAANPPFADGEENTVVVYSDHRSFLGSKGENLAIPVGRIHERIRSWESLCRGLDGGLNIC